MMTFNTLANAMTSPVRVEAFYLLVHEGPLTMGQVALRLGISASTATALVAVLREAELVRSWKMGREIHVDALVADVELVVTPLDRPMSARGTAEAAAHDSHDATTESQPLPPPRK